MKKIDLNPSNGFSFYGWMVTELHLAGAQLFTFALVHQFAQSDAGIYKGNTAYLAAWTGWSENTCRKHLTDLVKKGLLVELRGRENNSPFCYYKLAPDFYEKHPAVFEVSPLRKRGVHPSNFEESTPQKMRGEYNSRDNKLDNNLPPTPQAVADYVRSRGFADPEGFADYFLEVMKNDGWRMNHGEGAPVKNWKNYIVSSWERRHKNDVYTRAASIGGMKPFNLSTIL